MITEIGIVAGQILEILENKNRPVRMEEIQVRLYQISKKMIYMAVGYLAREGYARLIEEDNRQYLTLPLCRKIYKPAGSYRENLLTFF